MSMLQQYRAIEQELESKKAQAEALKAKIQPTLDAVAEIDAIIEKFGVSRNDVGAEMFPKQFAAYAGEKSEKVSTRKPRTVKVYTNPNTGETIKTKGGNHKGLKAWKEQYGADVVESWVAAE